MRAESVIRATRVPTPDLIYNQEPGALEVTNDYCKRRKLHGTIGSYSNSPRIYEKTCRNLVPRDVLPKPEPFSRSALEEFLRRPRSRLAKSSEEAAEGPEEIHEEAEEGAGQDVQEQPEEFALS